MNDRDRMMQALDCGPASRWIEAASEVLASVDAAMTALQARIAQGARLDVERLAAARLDASNTLARGRDPRDGSSPYETWNLASRKVSEWIAGARTIDLAGVDELAGMMLGESDADGSRRPRPLRTERCFNGSSEYVPPEHIEFLHDALEERLLARVGESHPIVEAALAARWVISVHPYRDANGRTSRLLADWILGAAGYLPATYASPVAAFMACRFEDADAADPRHAISRVARGVMRSIAVLEAPPARA